MEKEKQARKAEAALHAREKEAAARLAAADVERRRVQRKHEAERAEKVERCRKETARLLAKQQAEIDGKKVRRLFNRRGTFGRYHQVHGTRFAFLILLIHVD